MVQEIKKAFRAKYNKINLSNERLETYATKWASKIEDDTAIDSFLDTLDVEPLEDIAKLDDAVRAKAKQSNAEENKDDNGITISTNANTNGSVNFDTGKFVSVEQFNELKAMLENKTKSDLVNSRSEQLKNIPEELRTALKYTPLDALTDEQFTELKTDLTNQAEKLKVAQSATNPKFGGAKPASELTADEKRYLESKQKKS